MNDKGRQWSDLGLLKMDNIVMCVFVCAIISLQLRTALSLCVFSSLANWNHALRCTVLVMRFFRMCCRRGVLQSVSKREWYNECSLYVVFIFYNNTICVMVCLCVSLSWVQPTGTLESCFEVQCSGEELLLQNCRRGVMQTRSVSKSRWRNK